MTGMHTWIPFWPYASLQTPQLAALVLEHWYQSSHMKRFRWAHALFAINKAIRADTTPIAGIRMFRLIATNWSHNTVLVLVFQRVTRKISKCEQQDAVTTHRWVLYRTAATDQHKGKHSIHPNLKVRGSLLDCIYPQTPKTQIHGSYDHFKLKAASPTPPRQQYPRQSICDGLKSGLTHGFRLRIG